MKFYQSIVITVMMLTVATHMVVAQTPEDLSQWKPPTCIALNQRCYRTINAETDIVSAPAAQLLMAKSP